MSEKATIRKYQRALGIAHAALVEYGSADFYHAMAFMADRPAGGFAGDFDKRHGNPGYRRAMPGKLARKALKKLAQKYGDLEFVVIPPP